MPRQTVHTTQPDPRLPELKALIQGWLTTSRLVDDVDAFLGHGYVDLCLHAWPDASSARLDLPARWAVWTWAVDDYLDTQDLSHAEVWQFAREVSRAISGGALTGEIHPAVAALVPLATATRTLMPDTWWHAYQGELVGWIVAVEHKLAEFVRPGRIPSPREYQALRPADGGMVLAARWTQLATATVPDQRHARRVQGILEAFSKVGCLANDLRASDGEVFSLISVLAESEGVTIRGARHRATVQLAVEWERWESTCSALQEDAEEPPAAPVVITSPLGVEVIVNTPRVVRGLDQFLRALLPWTETSARYATPAATEARSR
ncbi:hypothetical protein GCM10009738_64850 [Kitasatospora viridis]